MGPAGSAETLSGYRALYRRALLAALAQGASLALARSRAALGTWDVVGGATFEEAERARVEEFAAFLAERGEAHPMRAGVESEPVEPEAPEHEGEERETEQRLPRIPPRRSLPGDKVRRGGKR
jgi:hypothetical protein